LIVAALIIIPFWQLFSKAGYSGWFSFLMVLPLIKLIALYVLAFSDWPALRNNCVIQTRHMWHEHLPRQASRKAKI
jgi:Na+/melibiose symporter-like transporter